MRDFASGPPGFITPAHGATPASCPLLLTPSRYAECNKGSKGASNRLGAPAKFWWRDFASPPPGFITPAPGATPAPSRSRYHAMRNATRTQIGLVPLQNSVPPPSPVLKLAQPSVSLEVMKCLLLLASLCFLAQAAPQRHLWLVEVGEGSIVRPFGPLSLH